MLSQVAVSVTMEVRELIFAGLLPNAEKDEAKGYRPESDDKAQRVRAGSVRELPPHGAGAVSTLLEAL